MATGLRPIGEQSEYIELPEGVYRFVIGEPRIKRIWSQRYNRESVLVEFPMELTEDEKERLKAEHGERTDGRLQSWRPSFGGYSCGLTLGRREKPSALADFLSTVFGKRSQKAIREWIAAGGCYIPAAQDNEAADQEMAGWLRYAEGLEVYGSIRHEPGERGVIARFGGPMAIGSLPGQPEDDYQKDGAAKARAFIAEAASHGQPVSTAYAIATGEAPAYPQPELVTAPAKEGAPQRTYQELFGEDGDE